MVGKPAEVSVPEWKWAEAQTLMRLELDYADRFCLNLYSYKRSRSIHRLPDMPRTVALASLCIDTGEITGVEQVLLNTLAYGVAGQYGMKPEHFQLLTTLRGWNHVAGVLLPRSSVYQSLSLQSA